MAEGATVPVIEGVSEAPMIAFDDAPVFGIIPGIGRVTLTAIVLGRDALGKPVERHVAVAHLRGNAAAIDALQSALESIKLMASPTGNSDHAMN